MNKKKNKVLVTILFGDQFVEHWNKFCKESWNEYAKKNGYDIVLIKRRIDESKIGTSRQVNWQKLLILEAPEVKQYEDIVWVDADIVINALNSPCIVEANNNDKVGVVKYSDAYNAELKEGGLARQVSSNASADMRSIDPHISYHERYRMAGLPDDIDDFINAGVLVLKKHHAELLRYVYDSYKENIWTAKENLPLSYHLLSTDNVNSIDPRFNKILDIEIVHHYPFLVIDGIKIPERFLFLSVNAIFVNSFFLHFIGGATRPFIQLIIRGGGYPDIFQYINANATENEYVVGDKKLSF